MADLIIKPTTGAGNKLIIRDQAGNDLITTGNNLAGCTTKIGGHLQMKQFRKLTTLFDAATGDSVIGAPFNGTSSIGNPYIIFFTCFIFSNLIPITTVIIL